MSKKNKTRQDKIAVNKQGEVLREKHNGRCNGAFGRGFKRAKSATEKGEK